MEETEARALEAPEQLSMRVTAREYVSLVALKPPCQLFIGHRWHDFVSV